MSFIGALHAASKDVFYDGYFIPKGTIIMGNLWCAKPTYYIFPLLKKKIVAGPSYTIQFLILNRRNLNQSAFSRQMVSLSKIKS